MKKENMKFNLGLLVFLSSQIVSADYWIWPSSPMLYDKKLSHFAVEVSADIRKAGLNCTTGKDTFQFKHMINIEGGFVTDSSASTTRTVPKTGALKDRGVIMVAMKLNGNDICISGQCEDSLDSTLLAVESEELCQSANPTVSTKLGIDPSLVSDAMARANGKAELTMELVLVEKLTHRSRRLGVAVIDLAKMQRVPTSGRFNINTFTEAKIIGNIQMSWVDFKAAK